MPSKPDMLPFLKKSYLKSVKYDKTVVMKGVVPLKKHQIVVKQKI